VSWGRDEPRRSSRRFSSGPRAPYTRARASAPTPRGSATQAPGKASRGGEIGVGANGRRRKGGDVLREAGRTEREPRRARSQVVPEHRHALGQRRGGRGAAVADDFQRGPLANLRLGARVQGQHEVGVRVDVDESRRDDLTPRVDHWPGAPVPSITWPPRISRSSIIGAVLARSLPPATVATIRA
jgi:hypothetical protein